MTELNEIVKSRLPTISRKLIIQIVVIPLLIGIVKVKRKWYMFVYVHIGAILDVTSN